MPDGQWYCHLFAREQPDLNWDNREVRDDFLTTLRFWADRGVDGYRVDVAHALAKDLSEPLRSKPTLEDTDVPLDGSDPLYDRNEVHEIYAEWRKVFDEYSPPRTAVAEAYAPSERRALYARPTGLGQAFNFELLKADYDARAFRNVITFCLNEAEKTGSSSTWVLSNHDIVRHATRYALPPGIDLDVWLMADWRVAARERGAGFAARSGGHIAHACSARIVVPLSRGGAGTAGGGGPSAACAAGSDLAPDAEHPQGPRRMSRTAAVDP